MCLSQIGRRSWRVHAVAVAMASVLTLTAFVMSFGYLQQQTDAFAAPQNHSLPPELLCLAPYDAEHCVDEALKSSVPVVRLREYALNSYELLYWGNPVRPAYAFSVKSLATGQSAVASEDGRSLALLPLPVTRPRRRDGKLPLQPIVRLSNLRGRAGDLYAARVSVHDARNGTVLCSEVFLVSGSEK